MPKRSPASQIRAIYRELFYVWGRQHWWPAASRFEVIIGAFLTQNTAWTNVERALKQLRSRRLLTPAGIRQTPISDLEKLVRSAGYFRQKAARLKNFVAYLDSRYSGSLDRMFARPTSALREELLALNGVGPETADSILLYAGNHPVFVVDAYTRRILDRHGILPSNAPYEEIRELFEAALRSEKWCKETCGDGSTPIPNGSCHCPSRMSTAKRDNLAQIYNEMHGLIVGVGKHYCLKAKPRCDECPLRTFLPQATSSEASSKVL